MAPKKFVMKPSMLCLVVFCLALLTPLTCPGQEPPAATQEPPAATQEPPAATQEPSAATQEPPAATQEPPAATQEPPAATQEPPAATQEPPAVTQEPPAATQEALENVPPRPDSLWQPLIARLAADGLDAERMMQVFSDLALPWSPIFMAAKVQELYGSRLGAGAQVKALPDNDPPRPPAYMPPTAGGIEGAKALLSAHAPLLADVHKRYGTPPGLIAAVIMLESNMGHELGDSLALHALASMAVTNTVEQALQGIEGYTTPSPALRNEMEKALRKRAARAYSELCALIRYCEAGGIDMLRLPGSVYGAIGLCQFMPVNIAVYGVDSDKKGFIDLFGLPDAAHSIGNFLKAHGFSEKLAIKKQVEVVRRYNHSDVYATLVLGLSYQLAGKRVPAELPMFYAAGGPRKGWWPKTRPTYRLPPLGSYRIH